MKTIISAALITLAAGSAAFASVQPIPGSITYENTNVQLEKAPAGSTFFHTFAFFNDTATTEIYTLSLHDALPISGR